MPRTTLFILAILLGGCGAQPTRTPAPDPVEPVSIARPASAPEPAQAPTDGLAPREQLQEMSAVAFLEMMRRDPVAAFHLLWDAVDIAGRTDAILFCLHQGAGREPQGCRQFMAGRAEALLDMSAFGDPRSALDFLLDSRTDATGLDLAEALVPDLNQLLSGGFLRHRLGAVVAARRDQQQRLQRRDHVLEVRAVAMAWVAQRPAVSLEPVPELAAMSQEDSAAFVNVLMASASAPYIQQLMLVTGTDTVEAARAAILARGPSLLAVDGGAAAIVARAPAESAAFIDWVARQLLRFLKRPDGRLADELERQGGR